MLHDYTQRSDTYDQKGIVYAPTVGEDYVISDLLGVDVSVVP